MNGLPIEQFPPASAHWRAPGSPLRHLARPGAMAAFAIFFCALLVPTRSSANCFLSCNASCSHLGAAGMQGNAAAANAYSGCLSTCQNRCEQAQESEQPRSLFGAITHSFGDGYTSTGRRGPSAENINNGTMEHCRANSKQPEKCMLVSSYQDSCGGLAVGSQGYLRLGEGGDTGKRKVGEAEAALLEACTQSGGTGCRIVASGCAGDTTPEEDAKSVADATALLGGLGMLLQKGLNDLDGKPPQRWEDKHVDDVNSAHSGSAREALEDDFDVQLSRQLIGRVGKVYSYTMAQGDMLKVRDHMRDLQLNDAQVIECDYIRPGARAGVGANFWYARVPITRAELIAVSSLHPLRFLGDKAMTACPKTFGEAQKVRQAINALQSP